ncbi:MAG TPA: urea amidolyase, partial [Sulfitobacter sp.]|nr:urea amidolyase [Sulfitobacter sp.]
PRANRMGVRMDHDGDGFSAEGGLSILSEVIVPGDIQITGDGAPFVLMGECQTTGGYPRIGTVIPRDLPRVAQAASGTAIRFEFITLEQAITLETQHRQDIKALGGQVTPLVRDPAKIRNLLAYQLVGGAISATDNPFEEEH